MRSPPVRKTIESACPSSAAAPMPACGLSSSTSSPRPPRLTGRRVFCLYPHQTRYVVPASAAHVLPDDVPSGRAVLAANLETAVNGLWDARPHVGDRIAVIGAGTVGCLAAWLAARIPGCAVELVDGELPEDGSGREDRGHAFFADQINAAVGQDR